MFTTATPRNRDMADVDRLKHWDEGSEHSNCLLIKLIKLGMINHSGLETVLGCLPMSALSKSKNVNQCIQEVLNSGMHRSVAIWMRGRQPDTRQPRLASRLPGCPEARLACIQRHTKMWWPVDP